MNGKLRNMTSVYLIQKDKILLLYRQGSRVVNNLWIGSAGGHFEEYELNDAKACVIREIKEELDINAEDIDGLELRYVTLRYTKGEIRQNYYFFANLNENFNKRLQSNEGICKWFNVDEIHTLEMPFTAKYVVEHFYSIGYMTDKLYVGVATKKGVNFLELSES